MWWPVCAALLLALVDLGGKTALALSLSKLKGFMDNKQPGLAGARGAGCSDGHPGKCSLGSERRRALERLPALSSPVSTLHCTKHRSTCYTKHRFTVAFTYIHVHPLQVHLCRLPPAGAQLTQLKPGYSYLFVQQAAKAKVVKSRGAPMGRWPEAGALDRVS